MCLESLLWSFVKVEDAEKKINKLRHDFLKIYEYSVQTVFHEIHLMIQCPRIQASTYVQTTYIP